MTTSCQCTVLLHNSPMSEGQGGAVWLPYQEEREGVRFKGVVKQPLLHLHSFHGVGTCRWEEELLDL